MSYIKRIIKPKNLKAVQKNFRSGKSYIKKYWRRVAILGIVLALVFLGYKRFTAEPAGITTEKVSKTKIEETVSASGKVKARSFADLKFNLPSKVVWVGVKKGDQIHAWQTLAALDQRILEKNLQTSLSFYLTSRWDFEQTNDDLNIHGRPIDEVLFDQATKRIVQKAQFALDRSVYDVQIKDVALKEAFLVSPIAGEVVDTGNIIAGENLTGADLSTRFFRVVDLNSLFFQADVDEIDYSKVHLDQPAEIRLDAFPNEACTGKVTFINREGQETTGGVLKIPVEIALKNCRPDLVVGLNGQADFVLSQKGGAIVIPKKYLFQKGGQSNVWVQVGQTPRQRQQRTVKVGLTTSTKAEITEGLQEGETIVFVPGS